MKANRLQLTVLLVLFIGLPIFLSWNFLVAPMLNRQAIFKSLVGKPVTEATKALGQPKYRLTREIVERDGVNSPWRDKHYQPLPQTKVTGEVLLYENLEIKEAPTAMYVFVNPEGRVEAIEYASVEP